MADESKIQIPITPSEPPAVKVIAARGQWIQTILQTVFAQVIEITIVVGATHALEMGKLSAELWLAACGFSATGGLVARVRGKPIVPTVAALGLWLVKASPFAAVAHHLVTAVALGMLLAGCAGSQLHEPDWAQVRQDANAMRTTVNDAVDDATQVGVPMMAGACAYWGERSVQCQDLRFTYELARQSVDAARKAIDAYDSSGLLGEQVYAAVDHAKALGGEFSDAAQAALEVVHHAVATQAPGPGTGDREPAPKEQTGPGAAEGGGPPNAEAPTNAAAAPAAEAP